MTALNPVSPVGRQIAEMFVLHKGKNWREANQLAVEALASVRVPAPERRVKDYPHQLSGGMRQRVMIAIALACGPDLLIADEPTTALDVTVQAEIIELMRNLCAERGTAILMISHDLGLVANVCRRVAVMYAGRIVEERGSADIFRAPLASLYARPGRLAAAARQPRRAWPDAARQEIAGVVPAITNFPDGCRFNPRCAQATDICRTSRAGDGICWRPAVWSGVITMHETKTGRRRRRRCHPQRRGSRGPFSAGRRPVRRRPAAVPCGRRRRSRTEARRVPRPGRRIRLRQVDGRACRSLACRRRRAAASCWTGRS